MTYREKIARIISPTHWAVLDAERSRAERKARGCLPHGDFTDHASLAKADEILRLVDAPGEQP